MDDGEYLTQLYSIYMNVMYRAKRRFQRGGSKSLVSTWYEVYTFCLTKDVLVPLGNTLAVVLVGGLAGSLCAGCWPRVACATTLGPEGSACTRA